MTDADSKGVRLSWPGTRMVKKVCPYCGNPSYSAAEEYRWICPHCHSDISHVKPQAITEKKPKEDETGKAES